MIGIIYIMKPQSETLKIILSNLKLKKQNVGMDLKITKKILGVRKKEKKRFLEM